MNEKTEKNQPEREVLNNEMVENEIKIMRPQGHLPFPESEVDLNEIFPGEENNLNDLFPEEETKLLLKKIQRNKKDLHTMTERFADDDWAGNVLNDDTNSLTTQKPSREWE
jgi:hypothetical protein